MVVLFRTLSPSNDASSNTTAPRAICDFSSVKKFSTSASLEKPAAYRQEAQLPQRNSASAAHIKGGGGLSPPAHSPSAPSGYIYAYGRIRKPQRRDNKCAVRKVHFKINGAFKVIQGHPYWCRLESRMVCCPDVQLMPTLFL